MSSLLPQTPHESICWRLGHYLFLQGGRSDLVMHVTASALRLLPQGSGSVDNIIEKIGQLFSLELSSTEVRTALLTLVNKAQAVQASSNPDTYVLDATAALLLETQEEKARETEATVLLDWRNHLSGNHPELNQDQLDELGQGLIHLLRCTYQRLGAEAVHLYSEGRGAGWPNHAEAFVRDDLKSILLLESVQFFSEDSPLRRQYLKQWFNGSLCIHTLYLDQGAAKVLNRQWSKGILYIDSNLLYRVLGLQGPQREEAAGNLIQLSVTAGFKVLVTTRTIDELSTSLSRAASNLKQHEGRISTAAAQRVLDDPTIGEDYFKAYCRARVKYGVSVDVFNQKFSNLKPLLKPYGILVDDVTSIELKSDEYYQLMLKELTDRRQDKKDVVQEHDAFHLRYIDKQRQGRNIQTLLEARVWFLTCDMSLLRYDEQYAARHHLRASRCILADAWLAFIPGLVPAVENFDAAWSTYVMNPLFQSYEEISGEVALKIIGNLGLFEGNYDAMTSALQDGNLRTAVKAARTPEEEQAAVNDWALQIADHYRVQAETALVMVQDTLQEAETRVSSAQREADRLVLQIKAETERLVSAANEQARTAAAEKAQAQQLVAETERHMLDQLERTQEQLRLELAHGKLSHRRVLWGLWLILAFVVTGGIAWMQRGVLGIAWEYFVRNNASVEPATGYSSLVSVGTVLFACFLSWCLVAGVSDHYFTQIERGRTIWTCFAKRFKAFFFRFVMFLMITVGVGIFINVVSPNVARDLQAPSVK